MYVPGIHRRSTSSIGLATDVGVLVLVVEVETEVVDNISSVFNDIGTFLEVLGSGITADVLKSGHSVGVGGSGEARQDALLAKEERASADGEDGSLASRVALLELREVGDETEGFGLLGDNLLRVTTDDDEDIKVLEAFMGLLVVDLRADDSTLFGENLGLGANNGDFESLGVYMKASRLVCV